MSDDFRDARNRLMTAYQKAAVATFDEGDWLALGMQTDTLEWVKRRDRLLRGAHWRSNEDYPGDAFGAITRMLDKDLDNINVVLHFPKIAEWIRENDRPLWAEFLGNEEPIPPFAEHATAVHEFLWPRKTATGATTKGFKGKRHDTLLALLRDNADDCLRGKPKVTIFQSLGDSGCDLLIEWAADARYGVQLKSHWDISQNNFAEKTLVQIQDSRAHGLNRLYVLLAGDLTDLSHAQKLRGFESRINKMKDPYIVTVAPERLWTLLFGANDE